MDLLDEIREHFATNAKGARNIDTLPSEYKAFSIKMDEEYGIAIEYLGENDYNEKFMNCCFSTKHIVMDDVEKKYLTLCCNDYSLKYELATLCAHFAEPGEKGQSRKEMLETPLKWFTKWCELMGNSYRIQNVYSVLAEMIVLEHLFKKDKSSVWSASISGVHDIESTSEISEVKSTMKRYGASITISSQFQLKMKNPLFLYFCRMEQSLEGYSINDIVAKLIADGYDNNKLEKELKSMGCEKGASSRDEKYKVLELRKYKIDEDFPKIIPELFIDGKIPDNIIHITYEVDLEGIPYDEISLM